MTASINEKLAVLDVMFAEGCSLRRARQKCGFQVGTYGHRWLFGDPAIRAVAHDRLAAGGTLPWIAQRALENFTNPIEPEGPFFPANTSASDTSDTIDDRHMVIAFLFGGHDTYEALKLAGVKLLDCPQEPARYFRSLFDDPELYTLIRRRFAGGERWRPSANRLLADWEDDHGLPCTVPGYWEDDPREYTSWQQAQNRRAMDKANAAD
jgi:hypothetical protein